MAQFFAVKSDGSVACNLTCTKCQLGLNAKLVTNCMKSTGASSPVFFVLGHSTGVEDDKIGAPHTGNNGRLLREFLAQAGIPESWVRFGNCLRCASHETKPSQTHWKACQPYLLEELKETKPQAIISLGGQALSWLTGFVGVRQFRRRGLPCLLDPSIPVYPFTQPISILQAENAQDEAKLRAEFVSDLLWLKAKAEEGTLDSSDGVKTDYKLAESLEDVKSFLAEFETVEEVIYDLETADKDLNPTFKPIETSNIALYAFSAGPGHARAIPGRARGRQTLWWWSDEEWAEIKLLLDAFFARQDKWFSGWNSAMYDNKWIYVKHGVIPRTRYDGLYHHYLLDENLNHNLEGATMQYTTMSPWKPPTLNKLMKDTVGLAKYACLDVDATARCKAAMPYDVRLQWIMETLMIPLSREYMYCELNGIAIDPENLAKYGAYLDELIQKHDIALRAMDVVKRYEMAENIQFNPDAPHQVAAVMEHYLKLPKLKETEKTKGYSTDASVLESYLNEEFVQHIYYLKKLTKLKSTYYEAIAECIRESPLVSTRIKLFGTVTGRASSQDPNLFNQPRPGTVKKTGITEPKIAQAIFTARKGPRKRKLIKVDLSQLELRVIASLSGDETMIKIFLDGLDMHRATAATVLGKKPEDVTYSERTGAKKIVFGLQYGSSERGIAEAFTEEMRLLAREEKREFGAAEEQAAKAQAADFIAQHKKRFPQLWAWLLSQERIIARQGYQETPFGRRRHYTSTGGQAKRQSFNYPIQSAGSDLFYFALLWSMELIRAQGLDALLVLTVYDSIILDCAEEDVGAAASIIKSVMEEALPAAFDWIKVPIKADVEVGDNLGYMNPWEPTNGNL